AGAVPGVTGSGRELYAREPVFREAVERCDEIVCDLGSAEIAPRGVLLGAPLSSGSEMAQAQVSSFTLGYGLSRMWLDWGVRPFAVLGHGVGGYTAACVARVVDPAAALRLVIDHSGLVQSTAPGTMLAVAASRDRVQAVMAEIDPPGVAVALCNGPSAIGLLGGPRAVPIVPARL